MTSELNYSNIFDCEFVLGGSWEAFKQDGSQWNYGCPIGPFVDGSSVDWWFGLRNHEHKVGEMSASPDSNSGWFVYEKINEETGEPYFYLKSTWSTTRVK